MHSVMMISGSAARLRFILITSANIPIGSPAGCTSLAQPLLWCCLLLPLLHRCGG